MAAFPTTIDQERCLEAGINEYVFKPFVADELAALLEKYTPWQMSTTQQITFHLGHIGGSDPGDEIPCVSGCVVDLARYRASAFNRKEDPGVEGETVKRGQIIIAASRASKSISNSKYWHSLTSYPIRHLLHYGF